MEYKLNFLYNFIGPNGPLPMTSIPTVFDFIRLNRSQEQCFNYHWQSFNLPNVVKILPSFLINDVGDKPFLVDFPVKKRLDFDLLFCDNFIENENVLSNKLLEKIINGNGYICFLLVYESIVDHETLDKIHTYFDSSSIPLNKVILITNCANGKELYIEYCISTNRKPLLNVEYIGIYLHTSKSIAKDKRYLKFKNNFDKKNVKKFLMFNRRIRDHRFIFLTHMFKEDLLPQFFMSFDKMQFREVEDRYLDLYETYNLDMSKKDLQNLSKTTPLILDNPNFSTFPMENEWIDTKNLYSQSFINIISETNFENNQIHLTEKTFKPILFKQPFIILGPPNTLNYLKKLGFLTFSNFWNEDYDTVVDPVERMKKVVDLVIELSKWSQDDFLQLYEETKKIRQHNYFTFRDVKPLEAIEFVKKYGEKI